MAPDLEEGFGDEECEDHEKEPDDDFGAPVAVLQRSAAVFGGFDAEEEKGEAEVEEAKGEVNALDSDVAVALFALAGYGHVVEC